jgi:hypothetical protein
MTGAWAAKGITMESATIEALADRLIVAEETQAPIEVLSVTYPQMTQEDGYALQRAIIRKKVARGGRVIGKKVAFTSRANQEFFGVHEPVYGELLSSGVHAESVPVKAATLLDPIVDCELTFVMRRRLEGPGVSVSEVLRASEGIMPSFELADSRMRDWVGRAGPRHCGRQLRQRRHHRRGRIALAPALRSSLHGPRRRKERRDHRHGRDWRGVGEPGRVPRLACEQAGRVRTGFRGGRHGAFRGLDRLRPDGCGRHPQSDLRRRARACRSEVCVKSSRY